MAAHDGVVENVRPMQSSSGRVVGDYPLWRHAARCGALLRTRPGCLCSLPVVRGATRCRMHGGVSRPLKGEDHPNYRHGRRTRIAEEERKRLTAQRREARRQADIQVAVLRALGLFSASGEKREAAVTLLIEEDQLSDALNGLTTRQIRSSLNRKPAVTTVQGAIIRLTLAKMVLCYANQRGLRFSDCWKRGGHGRLLRITSLREE